MITKKINFNSEKKPNLARRFFFSMKYYCKKKSTKMYEHMMQKQIDELETKLDRLERVLNILFTQFVELKKEMDIHGCPRDHIPIPRFIADYK